jgi:phosphoenolpyruvate-protein phosphotransferase (PTS system enzyme I)
MNALAKSNEAVMTIQVFGIAVSRGVAIGRAVRVSSSRVDVAHYFIDIDQVGAEVARLLKGRDAVVNELETLQADLPADAPAELGALLDVHQMLLRDEALVGAAAATVRERHYNAEWALSTQLEVLARQFEEMEDAYLRERVADLEQVTERILVALASGDLRPRGVPHKSALAGEDPLVLVASDVSPADMLHFKRSVFTGFVTDVGGTTSHTAIVARSMDIPAVVGTREASRLVRQDDWIIVDGDAGVVIIDPPGIVLEEYRFRQQQEAVERARLARLRHMPAITLDGQTIELLANIEQPEDTAVALEAGAAGVGLFRSEFLFMNRGGHLPDEDEQYEAYKAAVLGMKGLPVTIRTVDIGADKPLDRMTVHELRHEHTLNPALGLRAIRWSIAEPAMFRQQLRALLRASAHGPVRILIPMVAQMSEVHATLAAVERAKRQLRDHSIAIGDVQLGAMIEVPAAALIADKLLAHFDFVSIGTNDLIQYTLAIDRADEKVAHLYDAWHPAVLKLLSQTIAAAQAAGKPVSVCGELAGDTSFTALLLAMGLRSFSMHPRQISSVKQVILRNDSAHLAAALRYVLEADDPCAAASSLLSSAAVAIAS